MGKRWRERVLSTTRGRVLSLLRRGPRTVNELAEALDLTDNGVRVHLSALERDGLVEQQGARRGKSRPSYVYSLTPDAEALFPRAYAAVLSEVLGYVRDERGAGELESFLRAVGRRAGERARTSARGLRERIDAAVALLGEMGGLAEVEEKPDAFMIRGFSCPMAAIVGSNPEACALAEELIGGVVDAPVKECCNREGDSPRCAFRVARLEGSGSR